MKYPWRIGLFGMGACGLGFLYMWASLQLAGPGRIHSPYGDAINQLVVAQRHVTDAVTAVNFDYRGFDTLGEEFILFISVLGTLVLLREMHEKKLLADRDAATPERAVAPSNALHVWTLAMTGPTVLFGLYIVLHGQLTPGGGFQGGVILATAPLLVYLAEGFGTFQKITSHCLIEVTEAVGAGGYALIGMLGWLYGQEYLTNVLPLGEKGQLTSGGTIPAINLATALEVTGGFVLLLYAFLQRILEDEEGGG